MVHDDEGPTELRETVGAASADAPRSFLVRVLAGPDAGATLELSADQPSARLVGQSEVCDLRLSDRLVSRRHVSFEVQGASLRCLDLGSTNGTLVAGVRFSDIWLRGGEVVTLGATTLAVEPLGRWGPARPPTMATRFGKVVGASLAMRRLYPFAERLAAATVPVILEGETGTGKEAMAESLHEQGPRAQGPFVVLDCSAVPETLMEAELFGHERGAFTGASAARAGVLEQAHGGTLLLDEIGELPLSMQPKLLRAVERAEVRRLGGNRTTRVDIRLLAATRRDLDREVQEGRFREGLFHRLAVARLELPPLRARQGDVTLLARTFARSLGGSPDDVDDRLLARWEAAEWPGNVRELRNAVARHLALGDLAQEAPSAEDAGWGALADRFFAPLLAKDLPLPRARALLVEELERRYVEHALAKSGGNVSRAAQASGLARRYFQILRAKREDGR